jgi:hypothetical protein
MQDELADLAAFQVNPIYLPLISEIPPVQPLEIEPATSQALELNILELIQDALALHYDSQHEVISVATLGDRLLDLSYGLTRVRELLRQEKENLSRRYNSKTGVDALQAALQNAFTQEQIASYNIYDQYFNVIRVPGMTLAEFLSQVTITGERLVLDLVNAVLEQDEIIVCVQAIALMLEILLEMLPTGAAGDRGTAYTKTNVTGVTPVQGETVYDPDPPLGTTSATQAEISDAGAEIGVETERLAFYRWRLGHHFFNLCAIFGQHELKQVCQFLTEQKWQKATESMGRATLFWRATTSAMWYAGNFSAWLYQKLIRPSMVSTRVPNGFSGDQNADYARLKAAKEELKELILTLPTPFPAEAKSFYLALQNFVQTYVLDNEHHTLIAAAKVGRDTSLFQKEWQKELPEDLLKAKGEFSAVKLLREVTELRYREFKFVFDLQLEDQED